MVREKRHRDVNSSGGSASVFSQLERMNLRTVQADSGRRLPQEMLGDVKLSSPKRNLKPTTAGSPTNRSPAAIASAGRAAIGAHDDAGSKQQHANSVWGKLFTHSSPSALTHEKHKPLETLDSNEEHELRAQIRHLQQEVERHKNRADRAEAALQGERRGHEQDALEARMRSVLSDANS